MTGTPPKHQLLEPDVAAKKMKRGQTCLSAISLDAMKNKSVHLLQRWVTAALSRKSVDAGGKWQTGPHRGMPENPFTIQCSQ